MRSDGVWRDCAPMFINRGKRNKGGKFKKDNVEITEVSREPKVGNDDDLSSELIILARNLKTRYVHREGRCGSIEDQRVHWLL